MLDQQGQIPDFFRTYSIDNPFTHIEAMMKATAESITIDSFEKMFPADIQKMLAGLQEIPVDIEEMTQTGSKSRIKRAIFSTALTVALSAAKKYMALHNQLGVFNQFQQPYINIVRDTRAELPDRLLALKVLKEFDLHQENLSILNNMAKNQQEPKRLRRLAKRIVSQQKKLTASKCARTFNS